MSTLQTLQSLENIFPSGELDSNEPQLENYLHLKQIILLITSLEWLWRDRQDFFVAGNLTIYYSPNQKKSEDFRGPDFFVVLDTERRSRKKLGSLERRGKYPNVIVEILSESTAKVDRGEKKTDLSRYLSFTRLFWFNPETLEFAGFTLVSGKYQAIKPTKQGWFWSKQLGLYLGVKDRQLRFFMPEGQLVPTPDESARLAQQQVNDLEQAQLRAISRLDQLGLTLEQIAEVLSLSIEQVTEALNNFQ